MKDQKRVTKNFKATGAKIVFKNFAGRRTDFNEEGKRNFGILLSDEDAEMLEKDGWNVKYLKPLPDDPTEYCQPWLPVNVKFGDIPPMIYIVKCDEDLNPIKMVRLDEEDAGQLDWAKIEYSDIVIRPYNYPARNGREPGVSAYLKTIYCNVIQDDLEAKYGSIPIDDEEED